MQHEQHNELQSSQIRFIMRQLWPTSNRDMRNGIQQLIFALTSAQYIMLDEVASFIKSHDVSFFLYISNYAAEY